MIKVVQLPSNARQLKYRRLVRYLRQYAFSSYVFLDQVILVPAVKYINEIDSGAKATTKVLI